MQERITERHGTSLNPVQLHLLRMFSYMNSEDQLKKLKKVLAEYYFNEVEKGIDTLESQGLWGREQSDAVMNEHLRTPYTYFKCMKRIVLDTNSLIASLSRTSRSYSV